jgi:hypothetical protein
MRFIPHALWLAGVVVLLVAAALAAGASLPYPDLTPDLLRGQDDQFHTAKLIAGTGVLFFTSGVVWIIFRRASARRSHSFSVTI